MFSEGEEPYSERFRVYCNHTDKYVAGKLERPLTKAEKRAIRNTGSLSMLDVVHKRFSKVRSAKEAEEEMQELMGYKVRLEDLTATVSSRLAQDFDICLSEEETDLILEEGTTLDMLALREQLDMADSIGDVKDLKQEISDLLKRLSLSKQNLRLPD